MKREEVEKLLDSKGVSGGVYKISTDTIIDLCIDVSNELGFSIERVKRVIDEIEISYNCDLDGVDLGLSASEGFVLLLEKLKDGSK